MTLASADFSQFPDGPSLLFFLSIMLWWATMRPFMIRDYENRRLPQNPKARVLFVLLCLLAYVALVIAFHSFSDVALKISKSIPIVDNFISSFKDQAPLLAAGAFAGLLQISFFRDIERHTLVWLHSVRHLHADVQQLSTYFQRCVFVPSEDEKAKNRENLRRYGVFIVDNTAAQPTGPVTLVSWRKVSTLLRLVEEWNGDEKRVLNSREMKTLAEIETTHDRKTQLALTIVRMIEQATQAGAATETLSELLVMLADTSHLDRTRVALVEARARSLLNEKTTPASERPLRLTSEELRRHVAQIEGYFQVEYDFLVEQSAVLAAKSIVLSGDAASERFEQLKLIGFTGLGHIERINFDRVLWLFMVVACGGFLVLFLGNLGTAGDQLRVERLARFSLVMATAALIGANVGSTRRYQRRQMTPWGIYIMAGLAAAIVHVGMHAIWDLVRAYISIAQALDSRASPPALSVKSLPWALLPAFTTIAICRLSRIEHYPFVPRSGVWREVAERGFDGICTSGAVLLAYYLAIGAHQMMGWDLPPTIADKMSVPHMLPIPILVPLQILGFLIGFFAILDIRRAASARMFDSQSGSTATAGTIAQPTTALVNGAVHEAHPV